MELEREKTSRSSEGDLSSKTESLSATWEVGEDIGGKRDDLQ